MPKQPFDHSFAAIVTMLAVFLWYFVIKALVTGEAEMRGVAPRKRQTAPLAYSAIISAQIVVAVAATWYAINFYRHQF